MKAAGPGGPRPVGEWPEVLRKVLLLEAQRRYDNRAVMGGLDRLLEGWRRETEEAGEGAGLASLAASGALRGEYAKLSPRQRETWVRQVLEALEGPPAEAAPGETGGDGGKAPQSGGDGAAGGAKPEGPSLDSPARVVRGVGPGMAERLANLGVGTVRELLYHYPRKHLPVVRISELAPGEESAIVGVVWDVGVTRLGGKGLVATEAVLGDETGNIRALWFNQPFVAKGIHPGDRLVVAGTMRPFRGERTFDGGAYEPAVPEDPALQFGRLLPVYPSTERLSQRVLRRVVRSALEAWLPRLEDYLPPEIARRLSMPGLREALWSYHYPAGREVKEEARRRLAFDELLLLQLSVLSAKWRWQSEETAPPLAVDRPLLDGFLASLPFSLTPAQSRALGEVLADMGRERPMARLLQGEVGSGKTVVALAAMLVCAFNGRQAALMAPTEVLAEQHFATFLRLLQGLDQPAKETNRVAVYLPLHPRPIVVGLLLGSHSRRAKEEMKRGIREGAVDLVVGTHALVQEEVELPELALAVVDEQQRFGVEQRRALGSKGRRPHLLSMSATPIPRSLALTLYGDLDVSVIDALPAGRRPVQTRHLAPDKRDQAYAFVRRQVSQGRQVFVVCPLISESENLQTRAALEEHRRLSQEVFPDLRVGLLHGRMTLAEKRQAMDGFRDGEADILVSTPVVEVGVDVPNATVMLVEGADRFGLSELHQFRGRVGRGQHESYCILLADDPSPEATERLKVLEGESDGFRVAEEDLRLRGPGQLFGTRQSGLPDLRLASLTDLGLVQTARREAAALLEGDPALERPDHSGLARAVASHQAAGERGAQRD